MFRYGQPNPYDEPTKFSIWLHNELAMAGLSATAFSKVCGVSQPAISKYLRGIGQPTLTTFMKILKGLGKNLVIGHEIIVFRK